MNELGERIEKRCKELEITPPELAKLSKVNYKTLNRMIKDDDPNPTMENLKKISISLGISLDTLVFGEDVEEDQEIRLMINELKTVKKEDKKRIMYMVRIMIAESKGR